MEVLTQRQAIQGVLKRWDQQYKQPRQLVKEHSNDIRARIAKLDLDTCSKADVDAAIGSNGWASLQCNECNDHECTIIITVGQPPDYDSQTASLCLPCITKAFAKITAEAERGCK